MAMEPMNEADRDIGMCDICGSEEGTRRRVMHDTTINGEPERVGVWLCAECDLCAAASKAALKFGANRRRYGWREGEVV